MSKKREDFFWIPLVLGEFPDLPFLSNTQAIDFGDGQPDNYRRAFQQLLLAIKQQAVGVDPYFSGSLLLPEVESKM